MLVTLTTWRTGRGICQRPGDQIELPDAEARGLIVCGSAEPVDSEPRTAALPEPRTAALPRPKPAKRTRP